VSLIDVELSALCVQQSMQNSHPSLCFSCVSPPLHLVQVGTFPLFGRRTSPNAGGIGSAAG